MDWEWSFLSYRSARACSVEEVNSINKRPGQDGLGLKDVKDIATLDVVSPDGRVDTQEG